jgi:hypothetical protein
MKLFPSSETKENQKYKCTFCHKEGHIENFYFKKRDREQFLLHKEHSQNNLRKKVYKPPHRRIQQNVTNKHARVNFTNLQGPKNLWVPKILLKSNVGMSSSSQEKAMVLGQWLLKTYDGR